MRWTAILKRIQDIENPVVAEIGVFQGELSKHLLEGHPGLKLNMIDAWNLNTYDGKDENAVSDRFKKIYTEDAEKNYNVMLDNVENHIDRAYIIIELSKDAVKFYPNEYFDFVFIDASHDFDSVKQDIISWLPKVKKGGYICGHDYGVENFPDVKKAVDEIFSAEHIREFDIMPPFSGIAGEKRHPGDKIKTRIVNRLEIDTDYTWFSKID